MIELLLSLGVFILIALIILAVVFAIPRCIVLSCESENDPNHIYSIFIKESGYRGHKILSAVGCLFPFIELSKVSNDIEGIVFVVAVCALCSFDHSTVYKGYSVLTDHMKIIFVFMMVFLVGASMLARYNIIPGSVLIFFMMLLGGAWGGYAVYRRSLLIRLTKHLT